MSGFFTIGEKKTRPGIYNRLQNSEYVAPDNIPQGIVIAVVTGNWGELNKAVHVKATDDYSDYVGSGSGYNALKQIFAGGVTEAVVCRVGTGGTKGSLEIKNTASTPVKLATVTAKYPGTRALAVTVKASLTDNTKKIIQISEGTKVLEQFEYTSSANECAAFTAALADSAYVDVEPEENPSGIVATITQSALTGGAEPSVTSAAYSTGFDAVEADTAASLCCICVDSNDTAVHALAVAYVERIYEGGSYPLLVIGEASTTTLVNRMSSVSGYDDEKVHYVLNGWVDADGTEYTGYLAAARLAGMIAAGASNVSLTHDVIEEATGLNESLTNAQIEAALNAGAIVFSLSRDGSVRIEKAINTFKTVTTEKDAGWKKVRRTKTRFEMMFRIEAATDDLIGDVTNDENGRAAIIAAGQAVLDAMVGEGKIYSGAEFLLDEANPPQTDMAWFIIKADDMDSFEVGYLTYGFRFSVPADEA